MAAMNISKMMKSNICDKITTNNKNIFLQNFDNKKKILNESYDYVVY